MIRIRIGRVSLPGILAGLAMLSWAAPALAQGAPAAKWFRYAPILDKTWVVSEVPGNPSQFEIERKSKAKASAPKRILVLYPRASSAYDIAISKILQVFESKDIEASVSVINFAMKDAAGAQAIEFAEKEKIDLIFAMGSESTAWLFDHYRNGKIPVVSVCSKDPVQLGQIKDYETGSGTNFAFTSLNVPVDVQMAYVKELKPDLRNLTVLVDSKNISAVQTQAEPIAAYARDKGIQVIWGAIDNPAKAKDQLVPVIKNAYRRSCDRCRL
jgi:putative ABC transport system substrate-binding protein